jgi:hypothetical protein
MFLHDGGSKNMSIQVHTLLRFDTMRCAHVLLLSMACDHQMVVTNCSCPCRQTGSKLLKQPAASQQMKQQGNLAALAPWPPPAAPSLKGQSSTDAFKAPYQGMLHLEALYAAAATAGGGCHHCSSTRFVAAQHSDACWEALAAEQMGRA